MRRLVRSLGTLAIALTTTVATLPAQVAYTSRSAFESALASFTVEGFAGLAPAGNFIDAGIPLFVGPFTFGTTNASGRFFVIDDAFASGAFSLGSGAVLSPQVSVDANALDVTTPGGFLAFGLDFGAATGTTFDVFLDGTPFQALTYTQTLPTPQFFGFIASMPVSAVSIIAGADVVMYDNVTVGMPDPSARAVIPEPATVALVATGLAAMAGLAGRRRSRA